MLGLAPGIGAAFAGPAGASTRACADALGTQCGTFTESAYNAGGNSGGLGWDVKGQSTASNTPLIEYKNHSPGRDPGTDLTKVEHYGAIPGAPSRAPGIWYSIVFTPSGKWTSMCLSNPDNPGRDGTNLVLRSCNQQKWQAFLALPINTSGGNYVLPSATPPVWGESIPIYSNNTAARFYALYSVANRKFVKGKGVSGKALSATGKYGDPAAHGDFNSWYWTNATGK
jgi:hypothetical protein